ncbi:class I SAM-dependent methyltransferase [Fibrivirga algicola]|uniref:Class I SAM-dependent methyltransferase n=1 Tax=Fibrivirga algicola TaxID=2950420 RepID=A0ABX0QIJ8_9BACT|nr:methyltransferase domain-containing protein [Fibrivirga algicola]NID12265.1 class I SAM-dependent methyltransferase [Fibrivirga algicola]
MKSNAWIMTTLGNKLIPASRAIYWVLGLLLLGSPPVEAQKESTFGMSAVIHSKPSFEAGIAFYKSLYGFEKGEKIASVGAGRGLREVVYSMMADSLTLYIQDINQAALDPELVTEYAALVYEKAELPVTASFHLVKGTVEKTNLPKSTFDKVLLEHSLHEFTQQEKMLLDIRKTMKPGGKLFVWELMAKRPGRKHRYCKKQMITEPELLALTAKTGFTFVKSVRVFSDVRNGRLYSFALAE